MSRNKILFVIGTTAEAIKVGPILRLLPRESYELWATNQHPGKVEQYLNLFGIGEASKTINKGNKPIKSLGAGITWVLKTVFSLAKEIYANRERFSICVVHGDTATTAAGALAARVAGLRVAHIEAGLRTGNLLHPFPEEISRFLSDFLADINYAPSLAAKRVLEREFPRKVSVDTGGNTVRDAMREIVPIRPEEAPEGNFGLAFFHRGELLRNRELLTSTILSIAKISMSTEMVLIVDPVGELYIQKYKIANALEEIDSKNLRIIQKLPYEEFEWLMQHAQFLISDSPGQQQEARELGLPLMVHRKFFEEISTDNTVRGSGWNPKEFEAFASDHIGTSAVNSRVINSQSPSAVIASDLLRCFGNVA